MKYRKGIPLDYSSEFWDLSGTTQIFKYYKDKEIILEIIQKGYQYHLLTMEEASRKSDLAAMLLRGNHNLVNLALNVVAPKKMYKKIQHRW